MIEAICPRQSVFQPLGASVVFDDVQPVIGPYDEPRSPTGISILAVSGDRAASRRADFASSALGAGGACRQHGGAGLRRPRDRRSADRLPRRGRRKVNLLLGRLGFQQGGEVLFPPHPPAYRGAWDHNGEHSCCMSTSCPPARPRSIRCDFCGLVCGPTRNSPGPMSSTSGRSFPAASPDEAEYCRQKAAFLKMVLG